MPSTLNCSDGARNSDGSPPSFAGLEKAGPAFSCFEGKPASGSRFCLAIWRRTPTTSASAVREASSPRWNSRTGRRRHRDLHQDHDVRDHAVNSAGPRPQRPGPSLTATHQGEPALVHHLDRDHASGPGPSLPDAHPGGPAALVRSWQGPQVSGQVSTSGPGSATIQRVPAGVAQLAEQPSCNRQAELEVTWPFAVRGEKFGTYLA